MAIEDKKSSKKWVWIVVIVVVVLVALISDVSVQEKIPNFLLFGMSESKAREIIRLDYYNNPSYVCNKFFVSGDKCPSFMDCYVDKAIAQMPANPSRFLYKFAKNIKKGKSSAVDFHSLIRGKKIGEGCF